MTNTLTAGRVEQLTQAKRSIDKQLRQLNQQIRDAGPSAGGYRLGRGGGQSTPSLGGPTREPSGAQEPTNPPRKARRIGYGRVSTHHQTEEQQQAALAAAGCDEVMTETISSGKKDRPVLAKVMAELQAGDTLVPLPQAYYTLSPTGTTVVPKGKMVGFIDVQLEDAFLDDPRAFTNRYVIPLKLTSTETDSILSGKMLKPDADPRVSGDWQIVPKNYTLFGIKYINPYHGKYLYRGKDILSNAAGTNVDTVVYRQKFVEENAVLALTTKGRSEVELIGLVQRTEGSPGDFKARLTFDAQGSTCVISTAPGSDYPVSGTGKFIREGDEWGGKKRNTIILDYTIADVTNDEYHQVNDTLVMRDRAVVLEVFEPVIVK